MMTTTTYTTTRTKERQKRKREEKQNARRLRVVALATMPFSTSNDVLGGTYYAYSIRVSRVTHFSIKFPIHNPALPPPYLSTNSFAALKATSPSSLVISFVVYTFSIKPLDFTICSNVCTSWFFGKE